MADWIKWVSGLEDRAEVVAIAQKLNLPPVHVAGCCCVLWLWARQEGRMVRGDKCHIRHATLDSCDRQVAIPGFGEAMNEVEWLLHEDGGISFPRWSRHNSDSAKARALNQRRVRALRARKRNPIEGLSTPKHAAAASVASEPIVNKGLTSPHSVTLPSLSRNAASATRPDQTRVDKTGLDGDGVLTEHPGKTKARARAREGDDLHIEAADLRDNAKLAALYWGAVGSGRFTHSDANRFAFVASAEHCLRTAKRNAAGMFAEHLRKWPQYTGLASEAAQDAARQRCRAWQEESGHD